MEALGLAVVVGVVAASWCLRRWAVSTAARRTAERLRVSRETVARLRMIEDGKS